MAFYPFSSGFSSNPWSSSYQARRPADHYGNFFGQDFYQPSAPRYREPVYSPYQGLGGDYLRPRQTTRSPYSGLFGGHAAPARSRPTWGNAYDDYSSESEDESNQPPCTCGKCHPEPTSRGFRQQRQPAQRQQVRRPAQQQQQVRRQPQAQTKPARDAGVSSDEERQALTEELEKVSTPTESTKPETPLTTSAGEATTPADSTTAESTERHEQPAPAPEKPSPVLTLREKRLAAVESVQKDVDGIAVEVAQFTGERSGKVYLRLEDLLTKALLRLDGIEAGDDNDVRQARRAAVHAVQKQIDLLEGNTPTESPAMSPAEDASDVEDADEQVMEDDVIENDKAFAEAAGSDAALDENMASTHSDGEFSGFDESEPESESDNDTLASESDDDDEMQTADDITGDVTAAWMPWMLPGTCWTIYRWLDTLSSGKLHTFFLPSLIIFESICYCHISKH